MAARRQHGALDEGAKTAAASVHRRAAQVIDEQRQKIFAHVAAAVEGRDPEGVHDMRVATRRLRACLKVFGPWLDPTDLERLEPAIRTMTRALGTVRELDVLRLRCAELAAHAAPQRALAIECVDARLARRRRRARARMLARFAKVDLDRLEGRLRRLTTQLAREASTIAPDEPSSACTPADDTTSTPPAIPANGTGNSAEDQPIAALLESLAPAVLDEAREVCLPTLPDEVGTPRAAEALHAVRIAAKKLRYTLEIVAPYLGEGGGVAVRQLRAVQDKLGEFHDDTVLDDTLRPEVDHALERDRPLLAAELRALRTARRRTLLRDERAVRGAIAKLRENDFVGALAAALMAAGIALPPPPSEPAAEREDVAAAVLPPTRGRRAREQARSAAAANVPGTD